MGWSSLTGSFLFSPFGFRGHRTAQRVLLSTLKVLNSSKDICKKYH
nr:MAG TPA: hypothetical protein [Caudoviricetes sp.]